MGLIEVNAIGPRQIALHALHGSNEDIILLMSSSRPGPTWQGIFKELAEVTEFLIGSLPIGLH